MKSKNRYKFVFGEKELILTTEKANLFMEKVERRAKEKYDTLKEQLPDADDETLAILMAINTLSEHLSRELELEQLESHRQSTSTEPSESLSEIEGD